jgi:hypothetical protein
MYGTDDPEKMKNTSAPTQLLFEVHYRVLYLRLQFGDERSIHYHSDRSPNTVRGMDEVMSTYKQE